MIDKYVLATNDDGDLAIRTVSATESSSVTDTTSVITATDDGKLAVRVVGAGGSDPHNLGYYADLTALQTARPTGTDGDFAILGSTDTIWVWDSGTSAWKDTDTKGQVTSVNGQTGDVVLDLLPSQTGQSGKFLTTDGTDASWSDKPLVNTATGTDSLTVLGNATTSSNAVNVGALSHVGPFSVSIGYNSNTAANGVAVGRNSSCNKASGVAIGDGALVELGATAIGSNAKALANFSKQLGGGTNSDANTFKVGNFNGNFELMSADGTIPADRLTNAINKYSTMPTAASTNVGWIVQFTGTTDSTYTHGYIYECKAQGTDPETYAWEAVEVQAGGGGGLPDQTGNAGKFLTTDGTDASWSDKPLTNSLYTSTQSIGIGSYSNTGNYSVTIGRLSTASNRGIAIGYNAGGGGVSIGYQASGYTNGIAIGTESKLMQSLYDPQYSIAIGPNAKAYSWGNIQIGSGTNNESAGGTFYVALSRKNNPTNNYKMLDYDGTIPAARHAALPAADGTYTLQLVITNGVPTLSWVAA